MGGRVGQGGAIKDGLGAVQGRESQLSVPPYNYPSTEIFHPLTTHRQFIQFSTWTGIYLFFSIRPPTPPLSPTPPPPPLTHSTPTNPPHPISPAITHQSPHNRFHLFLFFFNALHINNSIDDCLVIVSAPYKFNFHKISILLTFQEVVG